MSRFTRTTPLPWEYIQSFILRLQIQCFEAKWYVNCLQKVQKWKRPVLYETTQFKTGLFLITIFNKHLNFGPPAKALRAAPNSSRTRHKVGRIVRASEACAYNIFEVMTHAKCWVWATQCDRSIRIMHLKWEHLLSNYDIFFICPTWVGRFLEHRLYWSRAFVMEKKSGCTCKQATATRQPTSKIFFCFGYVMRVTSLKHKDVCSCLWLVPNKVQRIEACVLFNFIQSACLAFQRGHPIALKHMKRKAARARVGKLW